MYKIAAMGDKDSVLGFKALGLEVCPVDSPEQGREALHRMAKENYAIIYMTEQLAAQLPQEIARYKDALTPARAYSDYQVTVDDAALPAGVTCQRMG